MWYLVVPPIIVVLSISFLLWYLSRKGDDPQIAQQVRDHGDTGISFPRTKEFFLRILEKSGQHFKVASLRTHNWLHEFTQSIKASRVRVHTSLLSNTKETTESVSGTPAFVIPEKTETASEPLVFTDQASIKTENLREKQTVLAPMAREVAPLVSPRPMVSEVAVHPERKKRVRPNVVREESLIDRIARDPKDFTAYEELGDYYLEMENIKDAKECYRQVLKLSPVHRMVKIKIRRLEKLLTRGGE
ncbi:MAG: tetratricopeptide repeat protein [Candidatus Moranbacteria bacterium]|nr:tetratricopeptide repeat protein [Candidatus Moranbacteria bacterium]